jgi:hypothetical protein
MQLGNLLLIREIYAPVLLSQKLKREEQKENIALLFRSILQGRSNT